MRGRLIGGLFGSTNKVRHILVLRTLDCGGKEFHAMPCHGLAVGLWTAITAHKTLCRLKTCLLKSGTEKPREARSGDRRNQENHSRYTSYSSWSA
nr:uncharacterized protein LOC120965431 isoform X2 [Aegilops tauschii subsp. strangulata]